MSCGYWAVCVDDLLLLHFDHVNFPSIQSTLQQAKEQAQYCLKVGPASTTLAQHSNNIG